MQAPNLWILDGMCQWRSDIMRYDSLSYVRSTSYSMVSCSQAAEDRSAMALQMLFTLCSTRELESGYAANIH